MSTFASRMVLGGIIPHLPKWLTDPFGYVRDKLVDLYHSLGAYIQNWIVSPPKPLPGDWQSYLYGNSIGLAWLLIGAVVFLVLVTAWLKPQLAASRLIRTFVILAVIGGLAPVWFSAGNWLASAGSQLSASLAAKPNTTGQILLLPDIHNVLGAIAGIFILLVLGGLALVIFFGYAVLFVIGLILGPILLALSPLGEGFRRKFDQIVGLIVVTSFLGRLVAVGILRIGTEVILHMPFASSTLGQVLTLTATLALVCYSQYWLLKKAEQVWGSMTGRTLGTARVTGMVETMKRSPRREADAADIRNANLNSINAPAIANPMVSNRYGVVRDSPTTTHTPVPAPRPRTENRSRWDNYRANRP